jgi:hypothetical protein
MGEKRNVQRILGVNAEGKISLARRRCRWQNYIKMDLRETGRGDMDWIDLTQDRDQWRTLVNMAVNLRVQQDIGKFFSS